MSNRSNISLVGNTTTGQNVGGGAGVFKGKNTGNNLQFKTISATGTSIQIFNTADRILISGATGGGGGGLSTANNGLCQEGSNVRLGGQLTGNTTIDANSFTLNVNNGNLSTTNGYQISGITMFRTLPSDFSSIFIGQNSGSQTGICNIAIGNCISPYNTTGKCNIGIGNYALLQNTTGSGNVAIGRFALGNTLTGCTNVAIGDDSLFNIRGDNNIGIGVDTMCLHACGCNNVAIGYKAMVGTVGPSYLGNYNVAIGYMAGRTEAGSNRLHIANSSGCSLIYGEFDNKILKVDGCMCITALPPKAGETCVVYINSNGKLSYGTVSGGTGGSGITGATNGICKYSSTNVCLGGTLTSPVTITTGSNLFTICGGNGNYLRQNINTLGAQVSGTSGCVTQNFSASPAYTVSVCDGVDNGYFVMNGTCSSIFFNTSSIQICGNCMTVLDGNTNQGFVYGGNYCANSKLKPRWIPDNAYVTGKTNSVITGATNLGSGNGTILVAGNKLQLKTLSGGTNVTLTCNGNYIAINASGGGGSSPVIVTNNDVIYTCKNVPSGLTSATNNILLGCDAGKSIIASSNNVALGYRALYYSNSTDGHNIAIGQCAIGCCNIGGYYNIGVGLAALAKTTTGYWNTALGFDSLITNTSGSYNIALGQCSSFSNNTGECNIALGVMALNTNSTGSRNIAIGNCAGYNETTSDKLHIANSAACTLIYGDFVNKFVCVNNRLITCKLRILSGATAGCVLTSDASGNATWQTPSGGGGISTANNGLNVAGTNVRLGGPLTGDTSITGAYGLKFCSGAHVDTYSSDGYQISGVTMFKSHPTTNCAVFLGPSAGANVTSLGAYDSIAIGFAALCVTSGGGNFAAGYLAMCANGIGGANVAIGNQVLKANDGGSWNIAMGQTAMVTNTSGCANIAMGRNALNKNTIGCNNIAMGYEALYCNTTATDNTALGFMALRWNSTGLYNIAVGSCTMMCNSTGYLNVAIGHTALINSCGSYGNIALGYQTMCSTTGGTYNTALGYQAMQCNKTGSNNIAQGFQALFYNSTGGNNIALGCQALFCNRGTSNIGIGAYAIAGSSTFVGTCNIGIGYQAFYTATGGTDNIGIGRIALYSNKSGNYNVGLGYRALYANTLGSGNVAIGEQTFCSNISGNCNVALGSFTLAANTHGDNNVAVGRLALGNNTIGDNNTAVGNVALYQNTTGAGNVAMGYNALTSNKIGNCNIGIGTCAIGNATGGTHNIGIGIFTIRQNCTGNCNVAIGSNANYNNTTGSNNIAAGATALYSNTTGARNIALGCEALYRSTTATDNIALGYDALYWSNGSNNIAIGFSAQGGVGATDNGAYNIAIGRSSMANIDTGDENIALGYESMLCNNSGNQNVAIGSSAYRFGSSGIANVAIGPFALQCNTTGNCNVAVGCNALLGNVNGSGNVAIGPMAGSGYTGSNIFWVANSGNGSFLIKGNFSDCTVCNGTNSTAWQQPSDSRVKENIYPICDSLCVLTQLNPVLYDYTKDYSVNRGWGDSQRICNYGFIAQEYEQVFPKHTIKSTEIVNGTPIDDFRSIDTGHLVPLLVKAIQEQQAQINALCERIIALEK